MLRNIQGITDTTYKYLISRNSGQPPYSDKSKLSFNFNLTAYRGYQTFNFRQFYQKIYAQNNHFRERKPFSEKLEFRTGHFRPKFNRNYFENVRFCKLERNRNWLGPVLSDLVTFKNWYLENDFKKT